MLYYVSATATSIGDGSRERPFKTISEAAALAKADDTVLVSPGVYRESVDPQYGGTNDDHRTTYRAETPGTAVISGAEVIINSLIEDNHIHHINNKQDLTGAEIGGIKMHAAIDVIYRRNHIHHCTRGLWLDWQAQGTRVTGNLFHDNTPPVGTEITNGLSLGEDLFVEVSHGPTLLDNNVLLSTCAVRLSTQGMAFEPEQLFENPDGSRIVFDTDYFGNHRETAPLSGPFAAGGDTYTLL